MDRKFTIAFSLDYLIDCSALTMDAQELAIWSYADLVP